MAFCQSRIFHFSCYPLFPFLSYSLEAHTTSSVVCSLVPDVRLGIRVLYKANRTRMEGARGTSADCLSPFFMSHILISGSIRSCS
jgi:hypothetical protein